jgi:hypothetical protein
MVSEKHRIVLRFLESVPAGSYVELVPCLLRSPVYVPRVAAFGLIVMG